MSVRSILTDKTLRVGLFLSVRFILTDCGSRFALFQSARFVLTDCGSRFALFSPRDHPFLRTVDRGLLSSVREICSYRQHFTIRQFFDCYGSMLIQTLIRQSHPICTFLFLHKKVATVRHFSYPIIIRSVG